MDNLGPLRPFLEMNHLWVCACKFPSEEVCLFLLSSCLWYLSSILPCRFCKPWFWNYPCCLCTVIFLLLYQAEKSAFVLIWNIKYMPLLPGQVIQKPVLWAVPPRGRMLHVNSTLFFLSWSKCYKWEIFSWLGHILKMCFYWQYSYFNVLFYLFEMSLCP